MIPHSTALTCCYARNRINVRLLFGEPNHVQTRGELTTYWFAPGQCFAVLWWARLSSRRQVAAFAVAEALDVGHSGFGLPSIDRAVAVHGFLNCRCVGKDRGVVGRAAELIQRVQQVDIDPCIVPPIYYRFACQALRVGREPRPINREELIYFLRNQTHEN